MTPKISIITPCYNSEKTISQTIESVLYQTYFDFEYIIIDGASTDGTKEIINFYSQVSNGRIQYISEADGGIYNAMNKGIRMASGDVIGIINSDDWYESEALESIANVYNDQIPSVYYGLLRKIVDGSEYSLERMNYNFIYEKMIPHPSCFVDRNLYEKFGYFDEKYNYSADYDLMIRYKKNNINFVLLDEIIANYRVGGLSSTFKAQIETLKVKQLNGLISSREFFFKLARLNLVRLIKY